MPSYEDRITVLITREHSVHNLCIVSLITTNPAFETNLRNSSFMNKTTSMRFRSLDE